MRKIFEHFVEKLEFLDKYYNDTEFTHALEQIKDNLKVNDDINNFFACDMPTNKLATLICNGPISMNDKSALLEQLHRENKATDLTTQFLRMIEYTSNDLKLEYGDVCILEAYARDEKTHKMYLFHSEPCADLSILEDIYNCKSEPNYEESIDDYYYILRKFSPVRSPRITFAEVSSYIIYNCEVCYCNHMNFEKFIDAEHKEILCLNGKDFIKKMRRI